MLPFVIQRLVSLLLTLVLVSAITFLLIRLVPGDPIDVLYGVEGADAATRAAAQQRLGLDQPIWVQYGRWLGRLAGGDLGYSFRSRMPVRDLIGDRLPATVLLVGAAIMLAVALGIPLGVVGAVHRDSATDLGVMATALVALSVPPFASGIALVLVFGLGLGWLPTMGFPPPGAGPLALLRYLTLPAITLTAAILGVIVRLTRSTVLEVLAMDYVRTARAKGLTERTVVFRHALRNALLPVVTLVGLQVSYLIGGTVVVEAVFAWPGIGGLVVDAILGRDYPVVQAVVLLIALMVVLVSVMVDLTYSVLDPRVRVG